MGQRIKIQAKAAVALGVTTQTLVAWKRQPWWQPEWLTKDGYDIEAIQKRPGAEEANVRVKYDESSRKMNQASRAIDLQLKQLQLQERSGELAKAQDLIDMIAESEEAFISTMIDVPIRLARLVPEGPLRKKLLAEGDLVVRNALRSWADQLRHGFKRVAGKGKNK